MRARVVVSLMRLPSPHEADMWLGSDLVIRTEALFVDPLSRFTAPVSALGPVVASLSAGEDGSRIIAAIDQVLTRAFG